MMYIPRIYQPIDLQVGLQLTLTQAAANHLTRVLRLQINDSFVVFNGCGGEFAARIISVSKNQVVANIEQFTPKIVESPLNLHLGQGISRGEKMDYVIQKAVELGVSYITPLITRRCGVKLSVERWDRRLQHWRAIAIAACEQCGRNQLPIIFAPQLLSDWLINLQAELKLTCHPTVEFSLKDYAGPFASIALFIGPESGIDEQEFSLAKEYGFKPLRLGPRILRTETAAIAAITAIQTYYGDMV